MYLLSCISHCRYVRKEILLHQLGLARRDLPRSTLFGQRRWGNFPGGVIHYVPDNFCGDVAGSSWQWDGAEEGKEILGGWRWCWQITLLKMSWCSKCIAVFLRLVIPLQGLRMNVNARIIYNSYMRPSQVSGITRREKCDSFRNLKWSALSGSLS